MSDEPGRWRLAFGVPALLAYLAGSLMVVFTALRVARAETLDDAWADAWGPLRIALLLVALGVAMQAVRERGEPAAAPGRFSWRFFGVAWAVVLAPLALGWLQFELYWEEIHIMPLVSLFGGVLLGVAIGGALGRTGFGTSATMAAVALVGLPIGALSFVFPSDHFRRHGSDVVYTFVDEHHGRREYRFEATLPEAPTRPAVEPLGRGTAELLRAFAEAKPVEGVIIDGEIYTRGEDGRLKKAETTTADELFANAAEEDARHRAEREAAHREALRAHEREVERIRRGGRLFNRRPP